MAAFVLPCAMFISCDSDDEKGKEETGPNAQTKITNQKVDIPVDNDFIPQATYIQGEWAGEYKGWDEVQKQNTTIRRRLILNPNGTYSNKIAGQLVASGKDFCPFESEGGTYTYNQSTGLITYTCEYDSVLNYREQTYTKYDKKHYYKESDCSKTYTEQAKFSQSQQGQRVWITKDMYLQSLTAEVLDLVFSMSKFDGDKTSDQNK